MVERRAHGQLKAHVLQLLRAAGRPLSARDIVGTWPADEPRPALTTVLTVLDRLRRANVVTRDETAGEYRFSLVAAPATAAAASMIEALLSSADRGGALLTFAGQLDEADLRMLRRVLASPESPADIA